MGRRRLVPSRSSPPATKEWPASSEVGAKHLRWGRFGDAGAVDDDAEFGAADGVVEPIDVAVDDVAAVAFDRGGGDADGGGPKQRSSLHPPIPYSDSPSFCPFTSLIKISACNNHQVHHLTLQNLILTLGLSSRSYGVIGQHFGL